MCVMAIFGGVQINVPDRMTWLPAAIYLTAGAAICFFLFHAVTQLIKSRIAAKAYAMRKTERQNAAVLATNTHGDAVSRAASNATELSQTQKQSIKKKKKFLLRLHIKVCETQSFGQ